MVVPAGVGAVGGAEAVIWAVVSAAQGEGEDQRGHPPATVGINEGGQAGGDADSARKAAGVMQGERG